MSAAIDQAGPSPHVTRVLITDDEAPARARLRDLLTDIATEFPHVIAGEAANAAEAIEWVRHDPLGAARLIILLDVEMPGMNGLEAARKLRAIHDSSGKSSGGSSGRSSGTMSVTSGSRPVVIFVTAFEAFALDAFEVHAVDYLLKPVRAARLLDALQRALHYFPPAPAIRPDANPEAKRFVTVHERGRLLKVPADDIVYLKAELKYVTIRTAGREYLSEEALGTFEDNFPDLFIRVHRNALVARSAIAGFERVHAGRESDSEQGKEPESGGDARWEVLLHGLGERLPISRRQWPAVRSLLKGPAT